MTLATLIEKLELQRALAHDKNREILPPDIAAAGCKIQHAYFMGHYDATCQILVSLGITP